MKNKYLEALLDMAERFGKTSDAERLKVGCLIYKNGAIISLGVNGQPPGWHTELCEDEEGNTLSTVRHAEDAALQKLWRSTETSIGATMIISHAPCLACSIKIVEAGIKEVIYKEEYRDTSGIEFLKKCNVKVIRYNRVDENV